jgi:hypothetical protein
MRQRWLGRAGASLRHWTDVGLSGGRSRQRSRRSFVLLPRGIPHAFTVAATGPCRMLTINTPAGFERFVAEAGRPAGRLTLPDPQPPDVPALLAAAAKYGHEFVSGPAAGGAHGPPGATTRTSTAPDRPAG